VDRRASFVANGRNFETRKILSDFFGRKEKRAMAAFQKSDFPRCHEASNFLHREPGLLTETVNID
jgi:hypothetical protein